MRKRLNDPHADNPNNPLVYVVLTKKDNRLGSVWRKRKTAEQYVKKFRLSNKTVIREVHLYDVVDLKNMHDGRNLLRTRKRLKEK